MSLSRLLSAGIRGGLGGEERRVFGVSLRHLHAMHPSDEYSCLPPSMSACGCRDSPVLEFNAEWLAITKSTHELLSRSDRNVAMPTEIKLVTEEDREWCVAACPSLYTKHVWCAALVQASSNASRPCRVTIANSLDLRDAPNPIYIYI